MASFTSGFTTPPAHQQHLESAKRTRGELDKIVRDLRAAITDARTFKDRNLTDAGLQARRKELETAAIAKYTPLIDEAEEALNALTGLADVSATKARPTLDPAALDRAWTKVRMRLDAGVPWQQIVENADTSEALALTEFGPAWMEAEHATRHQKDGMRFTSEVDTGPLKTAAEARLISTLGDSAGAPLRSAQEVRALAAGAAPLAARARDLASGASRNGGDLAAAIGSRYAEAAVRGTAVVGARTDGSAA